MGNSLQPTPLLHSINFTTSQTFHSRHTTSLTVPLKPPHTSRRGPNLSTTTPLSLRSTLITALPLANLTSTLYFASRKEKYNDDDGPEVRSFREREMTREEREEMRRRIKFQKEEKKQFYRANDGMWTSAKKQAHRAEIVQDHFRAEETYKVNEYNDYLKELKATRRLNVLEKKDKKMMGEYNSEDEEDDNPFPSNANQERMDKELKNVVEDRDKQAIYLKYEQKLEDETTKRMLWLAMFIVVVMIIPWDSRNPDTPF